MSALKGRSMDLREVLKGQTTVQTKDGPAYVWVIADVRADRVLVHRDGVGGQVVYSFRADEVYFPEPAKAVPGRIYCWHLNPSTRAVGLENGQLAYSAEANRFDFSPAVWKEVGE